MVWRWTLNGTEQRTDCRAPAEQPLSISKLVGRNKLAFAAASAVLGALVAGLALATFGLIQARTQRNEARASEKMARSQAAKSEQVASFLEDMLRGVGASRALGRNTDMLREILDKTAERVGTDYQPA